MTLPEVVVCTGIVLILIGLFLPSLSQAREKARAVRCADQLRQVGAGVAAYAMDNDGVMVPYHVPFGPLSKEWPELLFGDKRSPAAVCPTADEGEHVSYQFNMFASGYPLGRKTSKRPIYQAVLAGENLRGSNTAVVVAGPGGLTPHDPARHGPAHRSNYLWLDLHVSNDPPPILPGDPDGWMIR